ncbi:peptide chain release factor N(5)-glutamine methyltransferase [Neotabrizicola sp. VNH66]|uniref:peptide chain release factor N(5)-glutamine methyltransferase n=1 Tax=Neotabrizicola sp. VNH66 TaxID=3400918 RepID=UPI003C09F232
MIAKLALVAAVARLRAAGVEDPAADARALLAHAMQVPPARLALHTGDELTEAQAEVYEEAIAAREARRPVAQITGTRFFWGLPFRVTQDTLDPRPETEVLVAEALSQPFFRLLDLGTGTGCILLSCLHDMRAAQGLGVDASPAALAVAEANAAALGLGARATFALSDWCSAVSGRYDLIVSNPPYIAADEMPGLAPEVRGWEPEIALTPGGDGLDAYRIIARQAPARLMPGGRILLEIGPTQGAVVAGLLAAQGFRDIRVLPDLDGRDRVVAAVSIAADGCGSA